MLPRRRFPKSQRPQAPSEAQRPQRSPFVFFEMRARRRAARPIKVFGGRRHEEKARRKYREKAQSRGQNTSVAPSPHFRQQQWPLAAKPARESERRYNRRLTKQRWVSASWLVVRKAEGGPKSIAARSQETAAILIHATPAQIPSDMPALSNNFA